MNIAIVDDEQAEIDTLSSVIKEYAAANKAGLSLHTFHSAEELLAGYHPYAYTAIFMDVFMDGMDGVSAAEKILTEDRNAIIIFLTSSDEHMPKAFSLHAYDYIAKPAKKERLYKVLDDCLLYRTELNDVPSLAFSTDQKDVSIPYPDIVSVKTSMHNYLEITDITGTTYHTRLTFSGVSELLLADSRFLLILRGVIVNMDHIEKIVGNCCELEGGLKLSVNVRKAKELESTWTNYKISQIRKGQRERRGRKWT